MAAITEVRLEEYPDGFLRCTLPSCVINSHLCKHIVEAIEQGKDADLLWTLAWDITWPRQKDAPLFQASVQVPIVPGYDFWAEIRVCESTINKTLEAHLASRNTLAFLGFINPGEGREVLMSILDNFIFTKVAELDLKCHQSAHGFRQQMLHEANMKSSIGRRSEYWSFYLHDMCVACHASIKSEDFSDLIPDPGDKRSPF